MREIAIMKKKSISEMSETEKKRHSISARTVRSTIKSCILFGLVAQIVALAFYAISLTKQYINTAEKTARHAAMSAVHGADSLSFSEEVMNIYNSLSEEEHMKLGTEEYRENFSSLDMSKGSTYDVVLHMLQSVLKSSDVYDVYIAMYDRENSRIVYIVDPDEDPETQLSPGDWEPVDRNDILRFLDKPDKSPLYAIDKTEKYGLLCTVGVPLREKGSNDIKSFMLVDISIENILYGMAEFSLRLTLAMSVVTLLIAFLQTKHIKKSLIRPINMIAEASQEYVKDRHSGSDNKDHFSSLDIHTGDEIENLSHAMANMEHELIGYEDNLLRITAEKERIGTELTLATAIQASMLPHVFPPFPERNEFDIYALMDPAREIGGDFYDFFLIDDDHLCMVIADVSGKGIPAALFMMISKTILQSCAMLGKSAADILTKTNEALCSNNQVDMFVTVWLGILEISTGKLTAANAGHEYPVIKRADGSFEIFKDKHGFVIGGMDGTVYTEYDIRLDTGDKLFLYTDGVPEATNSEGKMFGIDRMLGALNDSPDSSPEQLLSNVRKSVADFAGNAEQFDDLTMLCIEYKKK